jgi:hypothetical protein
MVDLADILIIPSVSLNRFGVNDHLRFLTFSFAVQSNSTFLAISLVAAHARWFSAAAVLDESSLYLCGPLESSEATSFLN